MRRRRLLRRAPIVLVVLLLALAGAFVALRDSSSFAVEHVTVRGASGPDAPKVEDALRRTALEMTTLNADGDRLRDAVDGFPTVQDVAVDRDLPHGLTVTVLEDRPVAVVETGGRRVPVAADGRLLRGATPPDDVPALAIEGSPPGSRIKDPKGRRLVALVAAAPSALRRRALRASLTDDGLTLEMEQGPELIFGTPEDLRSKWKAVARVLADPTAEGATYVDVRVPERAVAGGLAPLVDPEAAPEEEPLVPDPTAEVTPEAAPVVPDTAATPEASTSTGA